jgi:hypothetical protein
MGDQQVAPTRTNNRRPQFAAIFLSDFEQSHKSHDLWFQDIELDHAGA